MPKGRKKATKKTPVKAAPKRKRAVRATKARKAAARSSSRAAVPDLTTGSRKPIVKRPAPEPVVTGPKLPSVPPPPDRFGRAGGRAIRMPVPIATDAPIRPDELRPSFRGATLDGE